MRQHMPVGWKSATSTVIWLHRMHLIEGGGRRQARMHSLTDTFVCMQQIAAISTLKVTIERLAFNGKGSENYSGRSLQEIGSSSEHDLTSLVQVGVVRGRMRKLGLYGIDTTISHRDS